MTGRQLRNAASGLQDPEPNVRFRMSLERVGGSWCIVTRITRRRRWWFVRKYVGASVTRVAFGADALDPEQYVRLAAADARLELDWHRERDRLRAALRERE